MTKRIVTLTTDWGYKDYYVASVKGKLLSLVKEEIIIIDITHQIPAMRIFDAGFVLKNCIEFFPPGTIHIIGVCSEASPKTPHVLVEHNKCFYVSADNGIFSVLFDNKIPDNVYEINVYQDSEFFTFPTRDVFVKVAASIINGDPLEKIGLKVNNINSYLGYFTPADTHNSISGVIIYIDSFGNLITNITKEKFKEIVKNKKFVIIFAHYEIDKISDSYQDVPYGEIVAVFNTSGLLEIAQNAGNAATTFGLKFNDMIKIIVQS